MCDEGRGTADCTIIYFLLLKKIFFSLNSEKYNLLKFFLPFSSFFKKKNEKERFQIVYFEKIRVFKAGIIFFSHFLMFTLFE